jgi:hypothetical protein
MKLKKIVFSISIMLMCLTSCTLSAPEEPKHWSNIGYVDSVDCYKFIVNDSISIQKFRWTEISHDVIMMYGVFINDKKFGRQIDGTFRNIHESDAKMIDFLEWKYYQLENARKEREKRNRTGCLKIK